MTQVSLEITITSMRKRILLEWLKIVLGLIVFAFGVHLTIFANIGLVEPRKLKHRGVIEISKVLVTGKVSQQENSQATA